MGTMATDKNPTGIFFLKSHSGKGLVMSQSGGGFFPRFSGRFLRKAVHVSLFSFERGNV